MALYRKKPLIVEAVRQIQENRADLERLCDGGPIAETEGGLACGSLIVRDGHYLVKGPAGFFVMAPDLFEAAYEPVEEPKKRGKRR